MPVKIDMVTARQSEPDKTGHGLSPTPLSQPEKKVNILRPIGGIGHPDIEMTDRTIEIRSALSM